MLSLLVLCSVATALLTLLMPWWGVLCLIAVGLVFFLGLIKPELTFFLTILVMIEELCQLFFIFPIDGNFTYTVRFFVYTIPLAATGIGLLAKFAREKNPIRRTPLDGLLLLLVAYQLLSIYWMPEKALSGLVFINLLFNLLLYFVTVNVVTATGLLRKTATIIVITGVINAAGIIASMFLSVTHEIWITEMWGFVFEFTAQNNRPGGFGGANHSAAFNNLAIFCALGMIWETAHPKKKLLFFLAVLIMAAGVILTESRGAFIGLLAATGFYIVINLKRIRRPLLLSVSAFALIVTLVITVQPSFMERMLLGFGYEGTLYFSQKDSFSGDAAASTDNATGHSVSITGMAARKIWWMNSFKEMLDNPAKLVFGLGCGGYLYYAKGSPEVNSISFSFLYDMGFFGLLMLMSVATILCSSIYVLLRQPEDTFHQRILTSFAAAMVAIIAVHGLIEFDLSSFGSKGVWFPVALSMATANLMRPQP